MEPLPPNDPVWDLLRKAKPAEPRANFVQNVVREARQTPQEHGLLAKIRGWWQDNTAISPGLTWAAATAVVMLAASFALVTQQDASTTVASQSPVAISEEVLLTEIDFPIVPEFVSELNQMEQMGDLVAVQDTSQLTSREIHLLLY
ncbi:MAG: hypothetical protein NTV80_15270 [Verrucomicrobia bacterium]|nr:hypothetical protein [Verrucomicrobiota bacterium]